MLAIGNNNINFAAPNCTVLASFPKDNVLTSAHGTFGDIKFSITSEKLVVNGITYYNDIKWSEKISILCKERKYTFSWLNEKESFDFNVMQGGKLLQLCQWGIYYTLATSTKIFINIVASKYDDYYANQVAEVHITDETAFDYEIHYIKCANNSIKKSVEKLTLSQDEVKMDLTDEQINDLTFDNLGFRDLQIILV
jgi:hypothetical protein